MKLLFKLFNLILIYLNYYFLINYYTNKICCLNFYVLLFYFCGNFPPIYYIVDDLDNLTFFLKLINLNFHFLENYNIFELLKIDLL
jgi:hypothetical protein